jgi:hypothetical protein
MKYAMSHPITQIDLPLDYKRLYKESQELDGYRPFKTHTLGTLWHGWQIRIIESEEDCYANLVKNYLQDMLETELSCRYFRMKKGFKLDWHVDTYTRCSFNFILSKGLDPIECEGYGKHYYKSALINTKIPHRVIATQEDRIMYRVNADHCDYEEVKRRYEESL